MRTVFFGLVLLFLTAPAWAASPLFTVSDVTVDVTAENAIQAREQAFGQAQTEAFKILAARMMSESAAATFAMPDPSVISTMIQDFEVTQEKLSSVRYVGTYTFTFKDRDVKNFFGGQGVAYTDVVSRPVLVLPFYQAGEQTVLWSPGNEWMQAWNRARDLQGLVPLVVPIGDLMDVADIGDREALTYDESKLARLLGRYDAGEAAVLVAIPDNSLAAIADPQAAAAGSLVIQIYRTDRAVPEAVQGITVEAVSGESKEQMFDRATRLVHEALQRNWKQKTIAAPQANSLLQVRVPIASLEQWAETQRVLERVYGVSQVVLHSLSPHEARVDLMFQGDEHRLRLALEQADMTLSASGIESAAAPVYDLYLNRFHAPQGMPGSGM